MRDRIGVDVKDPATWRGLGMMIVGYGMEAFPPDTNRWFMPLMLILIGAIGFFVRDEPAQKHQQDIEPASGDLNDVVRRNQ